MTERIENWLFGTVTGKIFLFLAVAPVGLALWLVSSLLVGEDFFEWLETRNLRKAVHQAGSLR